MRHVEWTQLFKAAIPVALVCLCTGSALAKERPGSASEIATGSPESQITAARITGSVTPGSPRQTSSGGWIRLSGSLRKLESPGTIFADGFETGDVDMWSLTVPDPSVPSGAVFFMNASACPSGWTEMTLALGRSVVGVPASGTVGGFFGTSTGNPGLITHRHGMSGQVQTAYSGYHSHWWSVFWLAEKKWSTYNEGYGVIYPIDWGDGIGNEGSGIYPLAANADTNFQTTVDGGHVHTASPNHQTNYHAAIMPYLYLKACQKD